MSFLSYPARQLMAEGEELKRRRSVQKRALEKALKSSKATGLKLDTFDTPTGVLRMVRALVCTL